MEDASVVPAEEISEKQYLTKLASMAAMSPSDAAVFHLNIRRLLWKAIALFGDARHQYVVFAVQGRDVCDPGMVLLEGNGVMLQVRPQPMGYGVDVELHGRSQTGMSFIGTLTIDEILSPTRLHRVIRETVAERRNVVRQLRVVESLELVEAVFA